MDRHTVKSLMVVDMRSLRDRGAQGPVSQQAIHKDIGACIKGSEGANTVIPVADRHWQ